MRLATREIVSLPCQGAELYGDQHRTLIGEGAHIIGSASDAGRSRDTSQAEDRVALNVWAQVHSVHQACINRWTGHARNRNEEDGIEVGFAKASAGESATDRLLSKFFGNVDPSVIRFSPGGEVVIRFDG